MAAVLVVAGELLRHEVLKVDAGRLLAATKGDGADLLCEGRE
jgi:hypothetical protein